MSDYARVHDFSVKDGLTTGDPLKVIKGSEVDAEFDAIVTMSATKIDEPAGPGEGDVLQYSSGAWTAADNPMPVGGVIPFAGTAAPTGWLLCDGSGVSTTTYAALFAVIGYTYGGAGATFNVPDPRGRVIAGLESSAVLLTSGGGGVDGGTLGAVGGTETHTLIDAELPTTTIRDPTLTDTVISADSITTDVARDANTTFGGDGAHANVQPTIIMNYIIKT